MSQNKQCPKCHVTMLAESLGKGKTKMSCGSCGITEIVDDKGRKQLTETMPNPMRSSVPPISGSAPKYLTEG